MQCLNPRISVYINDHYIIRVMEIIRVIIVPGHIINFVTTKILIVKITFKRRIFLIHT